MVCIIWLPVATAGTAAGCRSAHHHKSTAPYSACKKPDISTGTAKFNSAGPSFLLSWITVWSCSQLLIVFLLISSDVRWEIRSHSGHLPYLHHRVHPRHHKSRIRQRAHPAILSGI